MSKDFQFGAYYVQIARRNSNGYPMGTQSDPDNVAVDTEMPAYLMNNIIAFTPPTPTRDLATNRGGQAILGQADMGVSDLGLATLELSEFDDVFHTYITGGSVDTGTPTDWRQVASNVNNPILPSWFVMVTAQVNARVGTTITRKWRHWVMPNAQIRPAYPNVSQGTGVNPNPLSYEIVPDFSTRTITGELFSATDMNVEQDNDFLYTFSSSKRVAIYSYTGTGVASPETFTTAYLPLTTQATTSDKSFTENGVTDTLTAFSISTGVATTATAGAAGNIYVLAYATDFVPVS